MTSLSKNGATTELDSTGSIQQAAETEFASGRVTPELRPNITPPDFYRNASGEWNETAAPVVRSLFDALNENGVRYCHWKSNIRLGETLAGEQDIDLLVDRRDLPKLHPIMARCGFKTTVARAAMGHPGVFHALAFDDTKGRLVDLHVYHGIVTGDSLVKTYRLPLVDRLLEQTTMLADVRVPHPEIEQLMFVLRVILKHTTPLEVLKVNRRYEKNVAELAWLRSASDRAEVERLLPEVFGFLDADLYHQLVYAVSSKRALLKRVILGWKIAKRLKPYRRVGRITALISRTWRVLTWIRNRISRHGDLTLSTGGAIVALVGPKGTGKSTISQHIAAELGRHLATWHIHTGKPPAALLSAVPRAFVPIGRLWLPHERLSEYEKAEARHRRSYSLFHVVRMCQIAYDRSRMLSRAFRKAANGTIVVSDRYPSATVGAIDSRSFDDATLQRTKSFLKRRFMIWERILYRDMPRPDIVLRLVAPMDVAIARDAARKKEGGPDAAAILRRWDLETIAEFPNCRVFELKTDGPLEETVSRAIRTVWGAL